MLRFTPEAAASVCPNDAGGEIHRHARLLVRFLPSGHRHAAVSVQTSLRFYPSEADLWEWLSAQDNKQGYLKGLIRADMVREKNSRS